MLPPAPLVLVDEMVLTFKLLMSPHLLRLPSFLIKLISVVFLGSGTKLGLLAFPYLVHWKRDHI